MAKNPLTQSAGVDKPAAKPKAKPAAKSKNHPTSNGVSKVAPAAAAATSSRESTLPTAAKSRGRPPSKSAATKESSIAGHPLANTATPSSKGHSARGRKRKDRADDDAEDKVTNKSDQIKKARVSKVKAIKSKIIINPVPTERLDIYVFGEGSNSELGLGTSKKAIDVKRPRLNHTLSADVAGIVLVAAGGMHVVALSYDSQVMTWGVNDSGALGRDTSWEGGLKDIDDDKSDDSDDNDSGLNPYESTPTAIPANNFAPGTIIAKVAAGDSVSLALTDDGFVYGWGTFRVCQSLHCCLHERLVFC